MRFTLLTLLVAVLLPGSLFALPAPTHAAASLFAGRSLLVASSSPANEYIVGVSAVVTGAVKGDLSLLGGSSVIAAPIGGDVFVLGGSTSVRALVSGDLRAIGWNISAEQAVAGDFVALGGSVSASGHVGGSVFIVGSKVAFTGGAAQPVTIYGNNVTLAGTYASDVTVISGGQIAVTPGTRIKGTFNYEAPQAVTIPDSASIGTVLYQGSSTVPTQRETNALMLASMGVFLLTRILASLILAGLLAGLFPRLAEDMVQRIWRGSARSILLTTLLGFAAGVAVPVLILLFSLSFVGFGVALLLLMAYAFLMLLSLVYAGILIGGLFATRITRRKTVLWRDGVLGMLALSIIVLIPIVGMVVLFLLAAFSAGALLLAFFHLAFPHEPETSELL